MFDSNSSLPVSGGILLAGLAYIGVSVFITGPLVAERTIIKSDWHKMCRTHIRETVMSQRSTPTIIPDTTCDSILGTFLPELSSLCYQYGNPDLSFGATKLLKEQERVRQQTEERKLNQIASQAGSQCDCATAVVTENNAWALHAGSLRMISPTEVSNLSSTLTAALNSPYCAG